MAKLVTLLVIAGACALGGACVDDGVGGAPGALPVDGEPPGPASTAPRERGPIPDPPHCQRLPRDDSACAHACDPAVLRSYIPDGTCATFSCKLVDGTPILVGGCN